MLTLSSRLSLLNQKSNWGQLEGEEGVDKGGCCDMLMASCYQCTALLASCCLLREVELRGSGKVMGLIWGKPALSCSTLCPLQCTYSRPALGLHHAGCQLASPASQHQRDPTDHFSDSWLEITHSISILQPSSLGRGQLAWPWAEGIF